MNVAKLTLPADSPLEGKRVSELAMPNNSALVTVLRGETAHHPPGPDDVLWSGDELLFFVSGSAVEDRIRAMVQGSAT